MPHDAIQIQKAIVIFFLVLSLLTCFLGYRVWRVWLGINGFCLGFLIGMFIYAYNARPATEGGLWGSAIVGGCIASSLMAGIVPLGTFLYAGLSVVGLFTDLHPLLGMRERDALTAGIIVGVILGGVAAGTGRGGIIVSSSLFGGLALGDCIFKLSEGRTSPGLLLGIGLVVGIVGMIVQFATAPKPSTIGEGYNSTPSVANNTATSIPPAIPTHSADNVQEGNTGTGDPESDKAIAKLTELKKLLNTGLISKEEHDDKRKKIIDQL